MSHRLRWVPLSIFCGWTICGWTICGWTAFVFLSGCGEREFAEVEGTVSLNGKPLPGIEVQFLPDPEKGNQGNTSTGSTDQQGHYKLHNDRDAKDGTVLGMHRVLLIDGQANRDPSGLSNPPSRIPASYANAAQTPLKDIDIKPGNQQFDFDVKSPGP